VGNAHGLFDAADPPPPERVAEQSLVRLMLTPRPHPGGGTGGTRALLWKRTVADEIN